MKKLESLGKSLSKNEMKKIVGGLFDPLKCIVCSDCESTGGSCISNPHCRGSLAGGCSHGVIIPE